MKSTFGLTYGEPEPDTLSELFSPEGDSKGAEETAGLIARLNLDVYEGLLRHFEGIEHNSRASVIAGLQELMTWLKSSDGGYYYQLYSYNPNQGGWGDNFRVTDISSFSYPPRVVRVGKINDGCIRIGDFFDTQLGIVQMSAFIDAIPHANISTFHQLFSRIPLLLMDFNFVEIFGSPDQIPECLSALVTNVTALRVWKAEVFDRVSPAEDLQV